MILFLEDRHRLVWIQEHKKKNMWCIGVLVYLSLQRSQQTTTAEVLLVVQEPHAWVARAQLGGFYGAFLAQLQGQGEHLEFLGLGLSYRAKSVGVFLQFFHMFSYFCSFYRSGGVDNTVAICTLML